MKKLIALLLFATIFGCKNVKRYGPDDYEKNICKENMDTIINHLSDGWAVVDSCFNTDRYLAKTNKDGILEEYYHWIFISKVSDGKDTIIIITKPFSFEEWGGNILSLHFLSPKDVEGIKRHNLAIKAACKDTLFSLSVNTNKVMSAKFRKEKPKDIDRPLEDYGLKESDL